MRRALVWLCVLAHLGLLAPQTRAEDEPQTPAESEPRAEPLPELDLHAPEDPGPNLLGFGLAGAGLAAGIGLTVFLKTEADDRYDAYQVLADQELAREMRDSAERYDRLSLIGMVVAQVSFVALVVLLIEDRHRVTIPPQGEPLIEVGADGARVGWRVAP